MLRQVFIYFFYILICVYSSFVVPGLTESFQTKVSATIKVSLLLYQRFIFTLHSSHSSSPPADQENSDETFFPSPAPAKPKTQPSVEEEHEEEEEEELVSSLLYTDL